MIQILILVTIILAAAVVGLVVFTGREAKKHGTTAKEELIGICKSSVETASQKERRKQEAVDILRERGELSNSEIREALDVSGRSVVRYMDELEAEGKAEQVGKIGHAVTYRLK